MKNLLAGFLLIITLAAKANEVPLITNIESRKLTSLNGQWKIIIDPYENGFYDYRYREKKDGYFSNEKPKHQRHLIEYDFDTGEYLNVPGDWNSQSPKLELYENTIWYKKSFDCNIRTGKRFFVYFGSVNYHAHIYLNGKKIGEHEGGFTPFNFEITDLINPKDNFLVLKVDNRRKAEGVPTVNTDWYNYGGITRDVYLLETNENFIQDYFIQLSKGSLTDISGWAKLNKAKQGEIITVSIPELKLKKTFTADKDGKASFSFQQKLQLWSPANPKLYEVQIASSTDTLTELIGFRSIETKGQDILLNGKPIFLRGICIHEEIPQRKARANGPDDAAMLLGWAKEMGCNYVRLAHYPHNEAMTKMADKMGLMVWSEIPVYWTIQYENPATLDNAKRQLRDMVARDKNKASVIIWSMANETPVKDSRNIFIKKLIDQTREMDPTRLISAALELHHSQDGNVLTLDDPLGAYLDVLGCNEYIGWYGGTAESCLNKKWTTIYDKPLVMSEFGAEALFNLHGSRDAIWNEEYQEYFYQCQVAMLKNITFLRGSSPWILADFRSPRRHLPVIQDMWNRKGLISDRGEKKKAFFVMKDFYREMQNKYPDR